MIDDTAKRNRLASFSNLQYSDKQIMFAKRNAISCNHKVISIYIIVFL